jgi:serine/threonine protein kinase
MGTVFAAVHEASSRAVAIKVLRPEHAQKRENIERTEEEARIVATLRHRNVCSVFELRHLASGTPFLVLELLHGETLAARIERGGRLTESETLDILADALEGLRAAHGRGIVHRDVKPDNLFLHMDAGGARVTKILDFGISKTATESSHRLTRTGIVMGTPYYMAPEQAMGERRLDGRVDLWGLGISMYEALTGARPFQAANYNALLVQILTAEPIPIERHRPDLQPRIARLVMRALAKQPKERWSSAEEMLAEASSIAAPVVSFGRTSAVRPAVTAAATMGLLPVQPLEVYPAPATTVQSGRSAPVDDETTTTFLSDETTHRVEFESHALEGDPTIVDEAPTEHDAAKPAKALPGPARRKGPAR